MQEKQEAKKKGSSPDKLKENANLACLKMRESQGFRLPADLTLERIQKLGGIVSDNESCFLREPPRDIGVQAVLPQHVPIFRLLDVLKLALPFSRIL
jgi:hypothetical protein